MTMNLYFVEYAFYCFTRFFAGTACSHFAKYRNFGRSECRA